MNPSSCCISRSSKGSRRQRILDTGLAQGCTQPGAMRIQGNRPSINSDIVSVTMEDSNAVSAPSVAEDSIFRVLEAELVGTNESQGGREEPERALQAQLVLFQRDSQGRQLLQRMNKPPTQEEENSSFRIQVFLRNHALLASVICSILLLSAVGAGLGVAFSGGQVNDKSNTGNDVPLLPPSVTQVHTELPTVTTAPSELLATRVPNTLSPTLSPTMAPTATPTEETRCPEELEEYNSCRRDLTSFDSSFCHQCINDILQILVEETSCSFFTDSYCSSIDSCNCQGCEDKFKIWFNCFFQESIPSGCLGDCETAPPTPAPVQVTVAPTEPIDPCQAKYDEYKSCFGYLTDEQRDECVTCSDDVLSTTSRNSCAEYNAGLCNGLSACTSCGFCRDDLLDWADCAIDGGQCEMDCSTVSTVPPVPLAAKPPIDPPRTEQAPSSFTEEDTPVSTPAPSRK